MNYVRECVQRSRLVLFVFVMGVVTLLMNDYAYADIGMDYLIKHNLSARLYDSNGYSADGEGVVLSNSGAIIEGWEYTESKYLQIDILVDASPNETHIIELKLAPIFHIANDINEVPMGYSKVENIKYDKVPCNNGEYSYTLREGNGVFRYYLKPNMTRASIQVELRYDPILWDKFGGTLLTSESVCPVEVSMYHENSIIDNTLEVNASKVKVSKATSGKAIMGSGSVWYKRNHNSGDCYWDPVDDFYQHKDKIARIMIFTTEPGRQYINKYYKKMTIEVDVPYCEYNGEKVYVDYDKNSISFNGLIGANYKNINLEEATESKLIFSVDGYYVGDDRIIGVNFNWPKGFEVDDSVESVKFDEGKIKIIVIANSDKEKILGKKDLGYIEYTTKKTENVVVGSETFSNVLRSKYPESAVTKLMSVKIGNYGTGDSTEKNVLFNFNEKHLVTSIVLPVDTESKTYDIKYTLRDEDGKRVYLDERGNRVDESDRKKVDSWTITINNNAYLSYEIDNISTAFNRKMLPVEHRGYYIASLEYILKTIKTRQLLYDSGDGRYEKNGTGTIYGRISKNAKAGDVIKSKVTLTSPNDSGIAAYNKSLKSEVTSTETASYGVKYAKFSKSTMDAGESLITSGRVFVNARYFSADCTWLHGIRIALVLPKGASVDKDNIDIKTTKSKKVVKVKKVSVNKKDDVNIWLIDLDESQYIGYYTEELNELSQGAGLDYAIKLDTDVYMDTNALHTDKMMYVVGMNQENYISICDSGYKTKDVYDINEDGSTADYIGCVKVNAAKVCKINGEPPKLYIEDDVRVTDKEGDLREEDVIAFPTDIIEYNISIKSLNDGTASSFDYYIPIPRRRNVDDEYLYSGEEESAFDLKLLEGATITGDNIYEIMYTTDENLTYKKARDKGVSWYTAEELTSAGKKITDVTMVKLFVKSGSIEKGMDTTITLRMGYAGINIVEDKDKYVKWNSCGYYDFDDTVKFVSGHFPTNGVRIEIEPDESLLVKIIFEEDHDSIYYMYDVVKYDDVSKSEPIQFYVERPLGSANVTFTISESDLYTDSSSYIDSRNMTLIDERGIVVPAVNNQYVIKPNQKYILTMNKLVFGTSANKKMEAYLYAGVDGIIVREHITLVRVVAFEQH